MACHGVWDLSKQWHVTACEIRINNDMHCLLRSHTSRHVIVYSDLTCRDMSLFTQISHAVTCHCLLRFHMPWHVIVYSDLTCRDMLLFTQISKITSLTCSLKWHVMACEIWVNNDIMACQIWVNNDIMAVHTSQLNK
jgi:hypothetical protein